MLEWILDFQFNSVLGIALYWAPLMLCVIGYTARTAHNYRSDVIARQHKQEGATSYYSPTDRVGDLIGRAIVTVLPVANLWAAAFDVAPQMFSRLFSAINRIFSQPLVPAPRKREGAQ